MALAGAGMAHAASFDFSFPSASSTVVSSEGYFWSAQRGDKVAEIFTASGVFGATTLNLELDVTYNSLVAGSSVDWDVLVNGVDVGDWTWSSADGIGLTHLSYTFAPIQGEFTSLALVVKNEVISGAGSIALGYDTLGTITSAVPEPSTYLLLLAGLGVAGIAKQRRSR